MISFISILWFSQYRSCLCSVRFILKCFILWIINGIMFLISVSICSSLRFRFLNISLEFSSHLLLFLIVSTLTSSKISINLLSLICHRQKPGHVCRMWGSGRVPCSINDIWECLLDVRPTCSVTVHPFYSRTFYLLRYSWLFSGW